MPTEHAFGGNRHIVRRAVAQHQAEFVAGIAAQRVLAAHPAAQALGNRADHLIGDVEAVGFVDACEIVDRDQQESARRAETDRVIDGVFEHLGEMVAIKLASQAVAARQMGQLALMLVALGDDPDQSVRAHRLAVGAGKPAAVVLDPQSRVRGGIGADAILNLVGNAMAVVAFAGFGHRVEACLGIFRVEEFREAGAARDCGAIADQQHVSGVFAPPQGIAGDVPFIGNLADRAEDRRGIGRAGRSCGRS